MFNQNLINTRRVFLFYLAGLPLLSYFTNSKRRDFETIFQLDLSSLESDKLNQVLFNLNSSGIQPLLSSHMDANWSARYLVTRDKYLKHGLLLKTNKYSILEKGLILYKNRWRSEHAFSQFCREVEMGRLLRALDAQSFNMNYKLTSYV